MTALSFVGLGTMGAEMARRLVAAGHEVTVWNRSDSEAVASIIEAGARRVDTVADAMQNELVFSMLANDEAVLERFSEEALAAAPQSSIHVNMATVGLATADTMVDLHARAGIEYIAAPVLGRPAVAAAGHLNIVAGGTPDAIDRVAPFLDVLGKRVWRVGEKPRTANLVKIGVNYNLIHTIQALAESVTLVEQGGVDGQTFVDILTDVAFTGSAYTGYGTIIAGRDYGALFPVSLGMKDLRLTEEAAKLEGVTLLSAPVLRDVFQRTLDDEALSALDWSAVAEITRNLSSPGKEHV